MMKNETDKRGVNKFLILIAGALLILSFIALAIALTDDERNNLQAEFDNLTAQLNGQGYDWLVGYNISYPSVKVYGEGDSQLIARFNEIFRGEKNE